MLGCLVSLLVAVIIALIVLWVFEIIVNAVGVTPPPPILLLVRLLVALLVLLYALDCLGLLNAGMWPGRMRP